MSKSVAKCSLIQAVRSNNKNIVQRIIRRDVFKIAYADCDGWTSLHHAAFLGFDHILDLLLEALGPRNAKEALSRQAWNGETPLILACKSDKPSAKVIHRLLSSGSNPKMKTNDDLIALNFVSNKSENLPIVKMLLDMGGCPDSLDDSFITFFGNLIVHGDSTIIKYLVTRIPSPRMDVAAPIAIFTFRRQRLGILEKMLDHWNCPLERILHDAERITSHRIIIKLLQCNLDPSLCYGFSLSSLYGSFKYYMLGLDVIAEKGFYEGIVGDVVANAPCYEEYFSFLLERLYKSGMDNVVDTRVKGSKNPYALKYFPNFDKNQSSLKAICRTTYRLHLISIFGSGWKAMNEIRHLPIPVRIQDYLLYERELP